MVALEHRFFGESYPTPDMSNENLRYLTSSQVAPPSGCISIAHLAAGFVSDDLHFSDARSVLWNLAHSGACRSRAVHPVPSGGEPSRCRQRPAAQLARFSLDESVRDVRRIVPR